MRCCAINAISPAAPIRHACSRNQSQQPQRVELRRRNIASSLADVRGPAGRTRAVAIHSGVKQNAGSDIIEERRCPKGARRRLSLW